MLIKVLSGDFIDPPSRLNKTLFVNDWIPYTIEICDIGQFGHPAAATSQ